MLRLLGLICFLGLILSGKAQIPLNPDQEFSEEQFLRFVKRGLKDFYFHPRFEPAVADTNNEKVIPWDIEIDSEAVDLYFRELREKFQLVCARHNSQGEILSEDLHLFYGYEEYDHSLQWHDDFYGEKIPTLLKATISKNELLDLNRTPIEFENGTRIFQAGANQISFATAMEHGIEKRLVGNLTIDFHVLDEYKYVCLNDHMQDSLFSINGKEYKILFLYGNQIILKPLNKKAKENPFEGDFMILNQEEKVLGTLFKFEPYTEGDRTWFKQAISYGMRIPEDFFLPRPLIMKEEEFDIWYEGTLTSVISKEADSLSQGSGTIIFHSFNIPIDRLYLYEPAFTYHSSLSTRLNLKVKEFRQ